MCILQIHHIYLIYCILYLMFSCLMLTAFSRFTSVIYNLFVNAYSTHKYLGTVLFTNMHVNIYYIIVNVSCISYL